MFKLFIGIFIIFGVSHFVECHNYIKESPVFLKPCAMHGQPHSLCLGENLQKVIKNWKNGVPGLKSFGALDPFAVKKIKISQKVENFGNFNVQMKNVDIYGFSGFQVIESFFDEKEFTIKLKATIPHLKVLADYKVKGSLLLLQLDTDGKCQLDIGKITLDVFAKLKPVKHDDEYFCEALSVKNNHVNLESLHVDFQNLFGGNKELEASTNLLINENWSILASAFTPALSEIFQALTIDRFNKLFGYVPLKFFISDLNLIL